MDIEVGITGVAEKIVAESPGVFIILRFGSERRADSRGLGLPGSFQVAPKAANAFIPSATGSAETTLVFSHQNLGTQVSLSVGTISLQTSLIPCLVGIYRSNIA